MLQVVLASTRPQALPALAAALAADPDVHLTHAASGAQALAAVRASAPDLVIIDSELPDATPFSLVQQLLMVNAMVNTAIISPLTDAEFHEASEGLGVLGNLPAPPGAQDISNLLHRLRQVLGK